MNLFHIFRIRPSRHGLCLAGIIPLLCLVALPEAAIAKGDCFCLRDAAENLLIGCKKDAKNPAKTICFDQGKKYWVVVDTTGWTSIPEGKPGCEKCAMLEKKDRPTVIHGGGNGEEEHP